VSRRKKNLILIAINSHCTAIPLSSSGILQVTRRRVVVSTLAYDYAVLGLSQAASTSFAVYLESPFQ
jgi:hypothetical protein